MKYLKNSESPLYSVEVPVTSKVTCHPKGMRLIALDNYCASLLP